MTPRSRRSLLFIAVCFLLVPPAPAEPKPPAARPTLRFGVIAEQQNEPDRMLRIYADLLSALRARLAPRGIDVAPLVIAQDLADLSHRLTRKEVDMVAETLFVTLDLQTENLFAV